MYFLHLWFCLSFIAHVVAALRVSFHCVSKKRSRQHYRL